MARKKKIKKTGLPLFDSVPLEEPEFTGVFDESEIVVEDGSVISSRSGRTKMGSVPKNPFINAHVAVVQKSAKLSVKEEKVAYCLLYWAWPELDDNSRQIHTIYLPFLAKLLKTDERGAGTHLWEIIRSLSRKHLDWWVLDSKGRKNWVTSAWLAGAKHVSGRNEVQYQYSVFMREALKKPEVYIRLELDFINRFGSPAAMRLYMNCLRYVQNRYTHSLNWEEWQTLLGGRYRQFKNFNRKILKPAMAAVNGGDYDIGIQVHPTRDGKRGRRLQFIVFKKKLLGLPQSVEILEIPPPEFPPSTLSIPQIRNWGVTLKQLHTLQESYDVRYLIAQVRYVQQEQEQGKVANPAAYYLAACKHDYAGYRDEVRKRAVAAKSKEAQERRRQEEEARREAESIARSELRKRTIVAWKRLPLDRQQAVLQEALRHTTSFGRAWYQDEIKNQGSVPLDQMSIMAQALLWPLIAKVLGME